MQIILIDGNNIGFAGMHIPALTELTYLGQPKGGIVGVVQSVMRISAKYPEAVPVVLWDGNAQWRRTIYPEYKENRKNTLEKVAISESWKLQQPIASKMLKAMGVLQVQAEDTEADDLVGMICRGINKSEFEISRIILCSNDQDWLQALGPKIDWYSPITEKTMDWTAFIKNETGYRSTQEFILAKAMAGDSSDNIKGVPGVGMKTAVKLLRLHGGLGGITEAVESGNAKDNKSKAIYANLDLIKRNQDIMDWSRARNPEPSKLHIWGGPFTLEAVLRLCSDNGLFNLSRRIVDASSFQERAISWTKIGVKAYLEECLRS